MPGPSAVARVRREIADVARGATSTHAHLRGRLVALAGLTLAVDAVGSVLTLFAERHGHGTQITNLGDALFWTSAQLLTVSSQMANPVTTLGRVLDVVFEAYAITVVAALAGAYGAFFHRRGHERDPLR